MGWSNPSISWGELEKRLSGRTVTPQDPEAPISQRKRKREKVDVERPTGPVTPYAELHGGIQTIYGSELSLGLPGPQNGVADPEGSHLLVLARGVEGYHRLAGAITDAQLRGDEKG